MSHAPSRQTLFVVNGNIACLLAVHPMLSYINRLTGSLGSFSRVSVQAHVLAKVHTCPVAAACLPVCVVVEVRCTARPKLLENPENLPASPGASQRWMTCYRTGAVCRIPHCNYYAKINLGTAFVLKYGSNRKQGT
eukprot:2330626-Pleurochrysis_carterae.AAC.1